MSKRNKYFEREKKYLALRQALDDNRQAQRDLGYVELAEPIPHGFNVFFTLRKDIANREDAWVFQTILDRFGTRPWWKKNYFIHPPKRWECYYHALPGIREIGQGTYLELPRPIQKWFSEYKVAQNIQWYSCTVPRFFFEAQIEQNYRTRVRVMDEVLLQEEAELRDELYGSEMLPYSRQRWGAPKSYVKVVNRRYRRTSKQLTRLNWTLDEDHQIEYPIPGRHSAAWNWW